MNAELELIERRHYRRYNFHGEMYGESCETCAFIKEVVRLEAKLLEVTDEFEDYKLEQLEEYE